MSFPPTRAFWWMWPDSGNGLKIRLQTKINEIDESACQCAKSKASGGFLLPIFPLEEKD